MSPFLKDDSVEFCQELMDQFVKSTRQHIIRVNTIASFIGKYFPYHDLSKFDSPLDLLFLPSVILMMRRRIVCLLLYAISFVSKNSANIIIEMTKQKKPDIIIQLLSPFHSSFNDNNALSAIL